LGKFIDLTGQRFGRLVVEYTVEKPKNLKGTYKYWLCKCDCGNEKIIMGRNLYKGISKSCGQCSRIENLIDKRFGRLLVKEFYGKNKNNQSLWKCKCDCGNITFVTSSHLMHGHTKSCSCLLKELHESKRLDITGQKFGKLTVIKKSNEKYIYPFSNKWAYLWECECDCGNKGLLFRSAHLMDGSIKKDCGCTKLKAGQAGLNSLFNVYKTQAKNRNLNFELSKEIFEKLTKQNCTYCGREPFQKSSNGSSISIYIYNGLDRIDSLKGYTEDNVVPCCGQCNVAKMAVPQQDFLQWIKRVYNHSVRKEESLLNDKKN